MKRFVNTDKLCPLRARLRLCEKIKTELEKEAERKIRLAGEVHDKIERIYKNAVDFDGVKEQNYKLMDKIFK